MAIPGFARQLRSASEAPTNVCRNVNEIPGQLHPPRLSELTEAAGGVLE
jgi:hypothetical protein